MRIEALRPGAGSRNSDRRAPEVTISGPTGVATQRAERVTHPHQDRIQDSAHPTRADPRIPPFRATPGRSWPVRAGPLRSAPVRSRPQPSAAVRSRPQPSGVDFGGARSDAARPR